MSHPANSLSSKGQRLVESLAEQIERVARDAVDAEVAA